MGLTKSALRNFAKESGRFTALPEGKLAMDQSRVRQVHEFIENRNTVRASPGVRQEPAHPWGP